jgi:hypothetical protein
MSAARPTETVIARPRARSRAGASGTRIAPAGRGDRRRLRGNRRARTRLARLASVDAFARGAISATLAGALALVGASGLALGLAARVPGRERLALGAAIGALLGGLAIAAAGLAVPEPVTAALAREWTSDCFVRSLLLAIPSGLLAARFSLRGAPWRPAATGVGLAVGAVALGSLLVHASCPSPSAAHWLAAHALLPLAAGAARGRRGRVAVRAPRAALARGPGPLARRLAARLHAREQPIGDPAREESRGLPGCVGLADRAASRSQSAANVARARTHSSASRSSAPTGAKRTRSSLRQTRIAVGSARQSVGVAASPSRSKRSRTSWTGHPQSSSWSEGWSGKRSPAQSLRCDRCERGALERGRIGSEERERDRPFEPREIRGERAAAREDAPRTAASRGARRGAHRRLAATGARADGPSGRS